MSTRLVADWRGSRGPAAHSAASASSNISSPTPQSSKLNGKLRSRCGHCRRARDLAQAVRETDPADKADIYAQLKLTLTYQPGQRLVEATVKPGLNMRKGFVSEGGLEHANPGNFPGSGKSCRQDTRPLTPVNHLPSMASAGLSALSACLRGTGPECPAPRGTGACPRARPWLAGWRRRC